MRKPYRWGDVAPPAVQHLRDRRRQREMSWRPELAGNELVAVLRELLAEIRQAELSWIDE